MYDFEDVLSTPPPAAARSCQPPARMHCLPPPPSCHAISRQIALRCVLCPPPLIVSSAAQLPCRRQPLAPLPCNVHPPPLIVLSAAHLLVYLIVVCWVGGDGTWLPI
jgi:hypothetical protein